MSNHTCGHRAAKTPPAVKQDAPPAFTGTINTYAQAVRLRLLPQIEQSEQYVEDVVRLNPEQRENLSPASKLAHCMRVGLLEMMREELASLDAEISGGAV